MRTPEKKRIRTAQVPLLAPVAPPGGSQTLTSEYVFQDDVRLIGCEVSAIHICTDAELNADGRCHVYTELTRSSIPGKDQAILKTEVMSGWTAAILAGGELCKRSQLMFPEGHGIDFDENETVTMIGFAEAVGAVAGNALCEATLYFVER